MKRIAAVVVLVVLILLAVWKFRYIGAGSEPAVSHSTASASTGINSESSHPGNASPLLPNRVVSARSANYSTATNLKAYIDSLKAEGAAEKDIQLANAKALDECGMLSFRPNFIAENVKYLKHLAETGGAPDVRLVEKYAAAFSQRCSNFPETRNQTALREQYYAQAAIAGSVEAKARQLVRGETMDGLSSTKQPLAPDVMRSEVFQILGSGDAGAIFELSQMFGANSGFTGAAAGSFKTEAAWKLVACDMGLDCSENGPLLRQTCFQGFMFCSSGNLRENMRKSAFSPDDFQQIQILEEMIYKGLNTGNTSSLLN